MCAQSGGWISVPGRELVGMPAFVVVDLVDRQTDRQTDSLSLSSVSLLFSRCSRFFRAQKVARVLKCSSASTCSGRRRAVRSWLRRWSHGWLTGTRTRRRTPARCGRDLSCLATPSRSQQSFRVSLFVLSGSFHSPIQNHLAILVQPFVFELLYSYHSRSILSQQHKQHDTR